MADQQIDNLFINLEAGGDAEQKVTALDLALEKLITTLEKIDSKLPNIKDGLKDLSSSIGNVKLPTIDTTDIDNSTKKLEQTVTKIQQQIGDLGKLPTGNIGNNPFNQMSGSISGLEKKLDGLGHKLDKIDKKTKTSTKSTNNYRKGLRGLVNTAKQFLIFGTFFTIQRQISEAFKVGTNNAYQYSKAIGGDFANSMDRLATSFQYFRNSIGAWSSSLINAFAPVLEVLMDKLAVAGNAVARFFAALSGQETVLQAKKSMREYAAATDKATKSTQKSLAAFDEINNISSGSSGANIAEGSQDYGAMFETVELENANDGWTKFGKTIKKVTDFLGPLGTALVVVGIALGAFLIIRRINKLFDKTAEKSKAVSTDFTNFFTSLGKGAEAIAILGGLAIVINSITKLIEAFSDSGLTLGEVAGLLGIVLGELVGTFALMLTAMKFLEPSWKSIAGAVVIMLGLTAVINSLVPLIEALGKSGLSVGEMFGSMGAILLGVVGIVAALTAAAMILATNPLALVGVVAIAGSLSLVLVALGEALPPIIDSFTNLATNVAPYVIQAMELIRDTIADIPDFITRLGKSIENFVDSAIRSVTKLINFFISGIEYTINTLIIKSINALLKSLNKIPGVDFETIKNVKIPRFKPELYGDGGYPTTGQMFIARENGIPEMVGSIGGRTAVANNDQIVEAISIGVYNAYMDAMSRSGGNKQPTIVEINGREVFRAVQDESTSYRKRTGQPAF